MKTTGIFTFAAGPLALALLAGVVGWSALTVTPADAGRRVPDAVQVACSTDYKRFCKRYKVGTSSLNACMRSNGKRLSRVCLRALVDYKMVPRSLLRAARKRVR